MLTLEKDLLHVTEWQSYMDCDVLFIETYLYSMKILCVVKLSLQ